MPVLHVVRVFTDAGMGHGNPLGVFIEEPSIDQAQRQAIATGLGFSETVFVESAAEGVLRLYTPGGELPFAGHPIVGTAWLLTQRGVPVERLNPPAGAVPTWQENGLTWVCAPTAWCPRWAHLHAQTVEQVERTRRAPADHDHVQLWTFLDEGEGIVRARAFAPRFGVVEDEACGSASMILGSLLDRALVIRHGHGSEIFVRPRPNGEVELGGRVRLDTSRELSGRDVQEIAGAGNAKPRPGAVGAG